MFADITELISDSGNPRLYSDDVRVMLENYLPILRSSSTTTLLSVEPHDADVYEADLAGYLVNIARQNFDMHDLIMRMNYMTSPTEFSRKVLQLLIPDRLQVSRLAQALTTSSSS